MFSLRNREVTHLSAVHITNDADRLLQDEQFTYVYDANGNLVSQTEIATGAVTSYLWDAQDQLIGIAQPDGATVAYAYDALGRRSAKLIGAVRELYAYDGQDIYLEVDEANTVQARYAHGDRVDNPIAFERGGAEYYYHTDHQGSIRQVTDATGVVVNQYAYDSYGQFLERVETVAQLYGYTAREQDAESPLYYYRSRYYDPRTGRFTQEDRIGFDGNDINIYRYVGSNPVNVIDPSGAIRLGLRLGGELFFGTGVRFSLGFSFDTRTGQAATEFEISPGVGFGAGIDNPLIIEPSDFCEDPRRNVEGGIDITSRIGPFERSLRTRGVQNGERTGPQEPVNEFGPFDSDGFRNPDRFGLGGNVTATGEGQFRTGDLRSPAARRFFDSLPF